MERICDGAFEGGELETLILPKPDVDMVKTWLSDEARKHFHEDDLAEYVSKAGNKVSVNVREIYKTMPKRIACALQKQIEQGTLSFGSYYQMNDKTKKPIEWIVLEKNENRVLLLSKYVLDARQYHSGDGKTNVVWKDSDLRKWMNGEFFESILDAMERKLVSPQGDRVFCLEKAEAEKYFPSDEDRKCVSTAYAMDQGAARESVWCLSSTGYYSYSSGNRCEIYAVSQYGSCCRYGFGSKLGIRPAMWITLDP